MTLDADTVRTMLGMLQGPRIDDDAWVHDVLIEEDETGHRHHHRRRARGAARRPHRRGEAGPLHPARGPARRRGPGGHRPAADRAGSSPGRPRCPGSAGRPSPPAPLAHPVERSPRPTASVTLANGLVAVVVDPADGTFAARRPARLRPAGRRRRPRRLLQLLPAATRLAGGRARLGRRRRRRARARCGPRVRITATYRWPDHVDGVTQRAGRRARGRRSMTTVELRADEPPVRVVTRFVNPSRRPPAPGPPAAAPSRPTTSEAECAFAVVERGLDGRGPARRVRAAHLPLPAVRARPAASPWSTRACSSTSWSTSTRPTAAAHDPGAHPAALDRHALPAGHGLPPLPGRPAHAGGGPADARRARRAALRAGASAATTPTDWPTTCCSPSSRSRAWAAAPRPASAASWRSHGAEVCAVHRVAGVLEVRVYNPTASPATVSFPGRAGLAGRPARAAREASFEGSSSYAPSASPPARFRRRLSPEPRSALSRRSPDAAQLVQITQDLREALPAHVAPAVGGGTGASASCPTRPHHHSCTRPRSFSSRGRSACAVNSSGASCSRAVVELVRHQHGPGVADVDNPVGQVHGRPEVVAVVDQHRPDRPGPPARRTGGRRRHRPRPG